MKKLFLFATTTLLLFAKTTTSAQPIFTKVTDTNNPIVADAGVNAYLGASWVDYDNDNDLDLFVNNSRLYRNEGNGNFTKINTRIGLGWLSDLKNLFQIFKQ